MNKLDKDYLDLVEDVISNGYESDDRTGTGTRKVFGRTLRHNMNDGFPLLTSKKMFYNGIFHELLWFLKGDTNIKYLVDNNVYIWVGDCYKNYVTEYNKNNSEAIKYSVVNLVKSLDTTNKDNTRMYTREEFIEAIKDDENHPGFYEVWGELNKVYGSEWVNWNDNINQIQDLVNTLLNNPDSRRMLVTAWNPTNVKNAVLPPCHYSFQVFTRKLSLEERINLVPKNTPNIFTHNDCDVLNLPTRSISLLFNMRSVDVGLGLPFNIASYALLLQLLALNVNMVPDELISNLGDTHIYNNHIYPIKEQFNNQRYKLPKLLIHRRRYTNIFDYKFNDLEIIDYESSNKINLPLSN